MLVSHLDQFCMLVPQFDQFFMLVPHLDQFCMLVSHLDHACPSPSRLICHSTFWHRTWKHQPLVGWLHSEIHTCKKTSLQHLQRNIINIFTADNCLNKARTTAKPECPLACATVSFCHLLPSTTFFPSAILTVTQFWNGIFKNRCVSGQFHDWGWRSRTCLYQYCCLLSILHCVVTVPFSRHSLEAVKAKRPGNISWSWGFIIYWVDFLPHAFLAPLTQLQCCVQNILIKAQPLLSRKAKTNLKNVNSNNCFITSNSFDFSEDIHTCSATQRQY